MAYFSVTLAQRLSLYFAGRKQEREDKDYFNVMITMLIGGLWHGASLRFILWEGMHGAGLVVDKIRKSIFGEGDRFKTIARLAGIFITFNFVNFCWIFFRAESMDSAMLMLKQIWNNFSPGSYQALIPVYWQVILLIITGYIIHFIPRKLKESYRGLFIEDTSCRTDCVYLVYGCSSMANEVRGSSAGHSSTSGSEISSLYLSQVKLPHPLFSPSPGRERDDLVFKVPPSWGRACPA